MFLFKLRLGVSWSLKATAYWRHCRWPNLATNPPSYLGKNLLCADFSRGREAVMVPCTNDVDDEPIPSLNYVTKSRQVFPLPDCCSTNIAKWVFFPQILLVVKAIPSLFLRHIFFCTFSFEGQPIGDRACQHPLLQRQAAKACKGCTKYNPDDPSAPISVHVPFQRREDDFREDWQKERMYGRLPYDQNARLVVCMLLQLLNHTSESNWLSNCFHTFEGALKCSIRF